MTNTKERHLEILAAADEAIEVAGGVEAIDALPQDKRLLKLRQLAQKVGIESNCHIDTARKNVAKSMRRARFAVMQKRTYCHDKQEEERDNWGGARLGTGPDPWPEGQMRQMQSTRLAPGSKELAKAIAKILGLAGWGHAVDEALVRMAEGDQELTMKLAEVGIIIRNKELK